MKSPDRQTEDGGLRGRPALGLRSDGSCNGIQVRACGTLITTACLRFRRCAEGASGPPSKLHRISCTCSNLCFKWSCEISVLLAGHIWIICQGIAEIRFWRRGDGIVCTRQGPRGAGKRTWQHMRARQLQSSFCDMRKKSDRVLDKFFFCIVSEFYAFTQVVCNLLCMKNK